MSYDDYEDRLEFQRENTGVPQGIAMSFGKDIPTEQKEEQKVETTSASPVATQPQQGVASTQGFDPTKVEWNSYSSMFRPPEDKLNDHSWYAERYAEIGKQLSSDEFLDSFIKNLAKEKGIDDVEDFVTHYRGLKNNPSEYIKIHFADEAAKAGISPVLNEQQIVQTVHQKMIEEYGEDYASRYIDKEAMNPTSLSAKMLAKQQMFLNEIAAKNEQAKQQYETRLKELTQPQKAFEPTDEMRKESYKPALEAGYTMEEAIAIEKEIANGTWFPTMKDLLTIKNIDKFAQSHYEKGLADAKKGIRSQEWQAIKEEPKVVAQPKTEQLRKSPFLANYY